MTKEKTEFDKFCDSVELMTDEELESTYTQYVKSMNDHTNAAQEARNHWLVLRSEQKRRM